MPAVPVDPEAAIVIHAISGIDPSAFEGVKDEDFLLMHSLRISATRQTLREIGANGKCVLRIDYDAVLRYDLSAEVLAHFGLANNHPGTNLSTPLLYQALPFANGGFIPFGFRSTARKLIYEDPVLEMLPGDIPGITFAVVDEMNEPERADSPGTHLPHPDPDSIYEVSWPSTPTGTGVDYEAKHGYALLWVRTLNLVANGQNLIPSGANYKYLSGTAAGPGVPATADDFNRVTLGIPADDPGVDVLTEVFDCRPPGGEYWLPPGAEEGDIAEMVKQISLPFEPFSVAAQIHNTVTDAYGGILTGDYADLTEFLADNIPGANEEWTAVYHVPSGTWWVGP